MLRGEDVQADRKHATEEWMTIDRRTALAGMSALLATGAYPELAAAASVPPRPRRIATEEAFCLPEIAAATREMVRRGGRNLDLKMLAEIFDAEAGAPTVVSASPPPLSDRGAQARRLLPKLLDVDAGRLAEMDAHGVGMHLLSLGAPGVQMFDRSSAVSFARMANDRLAEIVGRHPTRYAGLAAFAPQDPAAAAREMERAIGALKLNGFLVNSHTENRYLDEPFFWPILEAAEALGAPIYLHPRAPSDGMAAPFDDYRLEGAIWGYAAEAGTHALRLMLSGTLDRFPKLQLVLGHMGEALPFWVWRLDFMGAPNARPGRRNQLKPSEYLRRNFHVTTSGVEDPRVLRLCIEQLGVERVMWAIDYPYQPTAPAVAFLDAAPLTDDERAAVSHRNAERVFRIAPET